MKVMEEACTVARCQIETEPHMNKLFVILKRCTAALRRIVAPSAPLLTPVRVAHAPANALRPRTY